jgi:hypothetical protein
VAFVTLGQKKIDFELNKILIIASDETCPDAERLKYLQMLLVTPGQDARVLLDGFTELWTRHSEPREQQPGSRMLGRRNCTSMDLRRENDPFALW